MNVSLAISILLAARDFQPVSKYNDSVKAKIESPVTIHESSSCTFSYFSVSADKQPSHTIEAYSNIGLIYTITLVTYCLGKVSEKIQQNKNNSCSCIKRVNLCKDKERSSD